MNRRTTLKKLLAAGGLGLMAGEIHALSTFSEAARPQPSPQPLYLFTKVLQWMPLDDLGQAVKDMGFSGIDLPVRKNGFFDVDEIKTNMPKITRQSENLGLQTPVLTTEITLAHFQEMEEFLKTLSGEGIKNYRMGWMPFPSNNIREELRSLNDRMKKAAELHAKYGVTGHYQNHAGNRIGGSVWEIHHLLEGINPDHIGIQFDLRHATVEGYRSYENVFYLVSDKIRSFDLKDFVWGNPSGKGDEPVNVPFGEGNVNFKLLLKHPGFKSTEIPKILHIEHDMGGAEHGHKNPKMPGDQILSAIQKDVETYSKTMG
ncbi:sugar phosphate isomerase/epimerase family protein [Negadavirga shengliensis]|uniref:Sugar phosphate isomerase/epimerase family protein n=1 Tax=Negadavirga shengliensis TaxID=1389218 RepID=A0ABV9T6V8_9BACT